MKNGRVAYSASVVHNGRVAGTDAFRLVELWNCGIMELTNNQWVLGISAITQFHNCLIV